MKGSAMLFSPTSLLSLSLNALSLDLLKPEFEQPVKLSITKEARSLKFTLDSTNALGLGHSANSLKIMANNYTSRAINGGNMVHERLLDFQAASSTYSVLQKHILEKQQDPLDN